MNPQQEKSTFSSMLYGNIFNDSITTNFMFRDKKEGVGIKFGIKTLVKPKELNFSFRPNAVFLNNKFNFNKDNYITLRSNGTISADVTLNNESKAGMHLYTTPDKNSQLNANLELFNIDLNELTSVIPFVPDIAGILNLELFLNKSANPATTLPMWQTCKGTTSKSHPFCKKISMFRTIKIDTEIPPKTYPRMFFVLCVAFFVRR